MKYYHSTLLENISFQTAIERVTSALAQEGFGVISTIDVKATMKMKLDVDFKDYTILGACNPTFAHQALSQVEKVGVMLPCNVVVIGQENGSVEVAAVDPVASMMAIENPALESMATEVKRRLSNVIASL